MCIVIISNYLDQNFCFIIYQILRLFCFICFKEKLYYIVKIFNYPLVESLDFHGIEIIFQLTTIQSEEKRQISCAEEF